MKHTAKPLKGNVNVPKRSPLKDLFVLLLGLSGILIGAYIVAGMAVNVIVDNLSEDKVLTFGSSFSKRYLSQKKTPAEEYFEGIASTLDGEGRSYRIVIANEETANAMALPGGVIVLFSGLINEVGSENELSFVLAHEIGHFRNRDHLKGLGRMLVFVTLSNMTLGPDSAVTQLVSGMMTGAEMQFSQQQEMQADSVGLGLLNGMYGHVGGAYDFFERVSGWQRGGRVMNFFSTHPYPLDRLDALKALARSSGFQVRETVQMDSQALGPGGNGI